MRGVACWMTARACAWAGGIGGGGFYNIEKEQINIWSIVFFLVSFSTISFFLSFDWVLVRIRPPSVRKNDALQCKFFFLENMFSFL